MGWGIWDSDIDNDDAKSAWSTKALSRRTAGICARGSIGMPSTAARTMTIDNFATRTTLEGGCSASAGHRRRCHRRLRPSVLPENFRCPSPVGVIVETGWPPSPVPKQKSPSLRCGTPSCESPDIRHTVALDGVAIKIVVALTKGEARRQRTILSRTSGAGTPRPNELPFFGPFRRAVRRS